MGYWVCMKKTDFYFGIKARTIFDYVLGRGKLPAITLVEQTLKHPFAF